MAYTFSTCNFSQTFMLWIYYPWISEHPMINVYFKGHLANNLDLNIYCKDENADYYDTTAHTQYIERAWQNTRNNIPWFWTKKEHYIGYVVEFMFNRKFAFCNCIDAFFYMSKLYLISE